MEGDTAGLAEPSGFETGTLVKQAVLLALLLPLVLMVIWAIPSSRSRQVDSPVESATRTASIAQAKASTPLGPPLFASRPTAELFLVASEERKASLAASLGHERLIRAALQEAPRVAWVVVAPTVQEAAIITSIAREQDVPALDGGVELRVTDLRNR